MTVSAEVVVLIAAAVAVFAAVLAVRAAAFTARTVLASQAVLKPSPVAGDHQAASASRSAVPAITLVEGHARRDVATDTRDYAFVVSIANPAGSDRQFDGATLRVTYRTRANFLGAVDLVSSDAITAPAEQAVSATLRFTTSNVIPRHCRVDAYTLLFTDRQGARLMIDASLPAVLAADTDGAGPASWGWD